MIMKNIWQAFVICILCACSQKDNQAPFIAEMLVNGNSEHFALIAGIDNQLTFHLSDNEGLAQMKISLVKNGNYANHEHGTSTEYYGLYIPNHTDFDTVIVRNLSGKSQHINITCPIPYATSGLWTMTVQVLDTEGNLQSVNNNVFINSWAYPFLSMTSLNPQLLTSTGTITGIASTDWNWQGDLYDLDSLAYVHITIRQNSDTVYSYINDQPNTWTMNLESIPLSMPEAAGSYQFRIEMADLNGFTTWRTSTLNVLE
jgi:hypothetical protein